MEDELKAACNTCFAAKKIYSVPDKEMVDCPDCEDGYSYKAKCQNCNKDAKLGFMYCGKCQFGRKDI